MKKRKGLLVFLGLGKETKLHYSRKSAAARKKKKGKK